MFKRQEMTQVEYEFIRAYVSAMKRDYYLLRGVLNMMNPDDLGVKSVTAATQLAIRAADLHTEFERQLGDLVDGKSYNRKQVSDEPPLSAMADLFSLSFFTIAVKTTPTGGPTNGLFSGEPTTLAEMLQHLQQKHASLKNSDATTQFLNFLKSLAAADASNSLFGFWGSVVDMFKNGSGLSHYGSYGQAYEEGYGNYEDMAEDDEDYEDDYEEGDYDDEYDD